jgi:membrane protein DedA with SNARE-associated domain
MWEIVLKILTIYMLTMLKFIFGPIGGYAARLNILITMLVTIAGMMTVVLVLTFSGTWFKEKFLSRFFRKREKFSTKTKKFVTIWKKYGLFGVAALTPVILTPIGGTVLALSSGSSKNKIIYYMLISASVWSVILTAIIYFFGNEVLPEWIP